MPLTAKPRRVWTMIALSAAVSLVGGGALAVWLTPPPQAPSHFKFIRIAGGEDLPPMEQAPGSPAWSPDGKRIAYLARVHGVIQVFTTVIGSPAATQLTHSAKSCSSPIWSPDGATIYYLTEGGLWRTADSGGAPERVIDKVTAAILHPDGNTVLFQRGGKMWVTPLSGGPQQEFWWQAPRKSVRWEGFSPDQSKLGVVDGPDIWIVPYSAGTAHKVFTSAAAGIGGASWFPDNRHLVITQTPGDLHGRIALLDVVEGTLQVIYTSPQTLLNPSVSPDGKRIAYASDAVRYDVLEMTLSTGKVRRMTGSGGAPWQPDWAPSGTHYLVSTSPSGGSNIEDMSPNVFSRRVAEGSGFGAYGPRWAPDGTRFVFTNLGFTGRTLKLSDTNGRPSITIAKLGSEITLLHSWSPDGLWIAAITAQAGKQQVVKIKPEAGAIPIPLTNAAPIAGPFDDAEWSPAGNWILYPSADGMSLVSPDGATIRKIASHRLSAYTFSKDGRWIYGIFHNTTGDGAQWQLYSLDVATGAENMLAPVDLPVSTAVVAGFSMHLDGTRVLTSIADEPYDIWALEGFDQPRPKTWLERLLRR
jgi:Tol biopolymer transport system component